MTRIDFELKKPAETVSCLGSGFIALDIVQGKNGDFAAAGGSCGNIVSILSWLGWDARITGRLKDDGPGDFLINEFSKIGVNIEHLTQEDKGVSPIVVQKFVETKSGDRTHRFSLSCPDCKSWLPRYRPATLKHADDLISNSVAPNFFFFDRANPATLRIANWASEQGAVIVFEPSSISEENHFQRALQVAHVLKYSQERLGHIPDLELTSAPRIIIKTDGENGLNIRWKNKWRHLHSYIAPSFIDAAGSGDWCTAGIIYRLGIKTSEELNGLRYDKLERAVKFGQALAAINCDFEGARGCISKLGYNGLNEVLRSLADNKGNVESNVLLDQVDNTNVPLRICQTCTVSESDKAKKTA